MNDTLKLLYERFYTPLHMEEAEQEIDNYHRQAHRAAGKTREKTGIADHGYQNLMAEERSIDSFLYRFKLA